MGLLKWLVALPWRVLRGLARVLNWMLRPLLGDFTWNAPRWMRCVAARPRTFSGIAAVVIVLVAGGWYGWHWYRNLPQPRHMAYQVNSPRITNYNPGQHKPPVVYPLTVKFSGSAAPIEQVDKPVTQGITIDPVVKGEWRWLDDRTLRFEPKSDWPVGQHYEVSFNPAKLLAPQVHVAKNYFKFHITAFSASLGHGEFYQNPENPEVKQVIQEIRFDYPADPARLEKRVHLWIANAEGKPGQPVGFTLTWDKHKLVAWIHSEQLPLPQNPGAVLIKVDSGVGSSRGGHGTRDALHGKVKIPGLYSLKVDDLKPTLVENDQNKPQQVLVANFSASVRATDVAKRIHAWVLPQYKPGSKHDDNKQYHYWWDVSEVGEKVLEHSHKLDLSVTPTERSWEPLQSFKFHAQPGQRVYVRIDKGLKSFGGYVMGKPLVRVVTVPDYPQLLSFVGSGSLLSMSGSKRISVVSRNLPGFKLDIGRVLPDQLQHLVSLNYGDYSHPRLPYNFSENQIAERFIATRDIPGDNPAHKTYTGIDLGKYLDNGKRGVFWVRLSGYDPVAAKREAEEAARQCAAAKRELARPMLTAVSEAGLYACRHEGETAGEMRGAPSDNRLIVITDLGMIVKKANDGRQKVFIQSIRTGKPVAGAKVAVVAINGETLLSHVTGAGGMVAFPSLQGLDGDKQPVMYRVTKGRDMSFLPIGAAGRQLDYSRFNVGGATNEVNPGTLSGYLFSDRGLYRPGESFHIGVIVRAADWTQSVAGIPLVAAVINPRGHTVKQFPLTMDETGFDELSYKLAKTAATGTWTVNVYITRDGKAHTFIGSTTVSVKQFQAERMKVRASLSRHVANGWVKPDQLKGEVDATNLFGTPAANRRVTASILLRSASLHFKGWSGWHFHDTRRAKLGYQSDLEARHTDAQGHAEFPLHLDKYKDATYRLYFFAKVYEAGSGRGVSANTEAMVSNNDWLVGYKSDDDLGYITRNSERKVRLVAINSKAKSIELSGLVAQLVRREHVSVLTKQHSGVYKYESHLKEIPVSSHPLVIPENGMTVTLETDKPGSYALKILRASDRKEVNLIEYTVAGASNVSRSLEHNAELHIALDKRVYTPGDTISVSIRSPYTGSGLITIERDKVYAHAWFHTDTTSSVQTITIPADFEGDGYVNVQFVRDPSSDAIFTSPLSYAVASFRISHAAHRDKLSVDVPKLIKPGKTVTFKLHAAHPAKVVLFAVNEGILQVARYNFENPLDYFFRKRMLGVSTSQILSLILPEFEQLMRNKSAPGGGASRFAALVERHLNPFHRKEKKPVVYWSGVVEVNGEKDFAYKVPDDFNGKLRVMAVAVSPERIGAWQGMTTVRGDFVLSPNTPTTLTPGDEAVVSVGVANNLTDIGNRAVPVSVTLGTGAGLTVVGPATQSVSLASMKEGEVTFRVKATDRLGSADLAFTARHGKHLVKLGTTISVRPAAAYRISIDTDRVAPDSHVNFDRLRDLYTQFAARNAVMSSSPIVLARGITSYLINYPNYCTEQIISSAMPRLIVTDWPAAQAFIQALQPTLNKKPIDNSEALSHFLSTLQSRQNDAGGFGLWAATPTSLPFISDYAMNFLLEARARGVAVPQSMIDAGNAYLRELAANHGLSSLSELRARAYAIYLLTAQGNVTTNYIASVQNRLDELFPKKWKVDIAAAWLAASYKLMKQDAEADKLIAGPLKVLERNKPDMDNFHFAHYYSPAIRDATLLYLLARQFPRRANSLSARVFENIAWPLEHDRYNTLSSAMTLLALDAYASVNVKGLEKMKIEQVMMSGNTRSIGKIAGNLLQANGWNAQASKLRFINRGRQQAWSVVTQSGYDRSAPTQAIKQGLEIVRDYTDDQGRPLDKITLGQEVEVHVKIRAIGEAIVPDVVIVDLLPGGFEPVREAGSFGLGSSTWRPDFTDVREDRVVLYGAANSAVREFVYKIRATNAGAFHAPPVYASSMYRPGIQAEAPGGEVLTVVPPQS